MAARLPSKLGREPAHDLALVISDLGSGGAQRVLMHLVEAWHGSGRRVAVITLAPPETDFFHLPAQVTRLVLNNVKRSRGKLGGLFANLARVRQLRIALRSTGAPVALAFITPTAVLTLIAARGLGIGVIACERNDPNRQSFGLVWSGLRRLTYRWAEVVTANSRGAVASLCAFVPGHKLLYVENPVVPAPAGEAVSLTRPMVLSVGRLHPQKAHDVLLRAFAGFSATHPDWCIAIMGEGPAEADLRALAEDLAITRQVHWLGTLADPYPWLRAARIFALPSRHEGTPNALLEAMSCGLPCIVSDASPGPLELIEDNVSGLVVAVEDQSALAVALRRLADDTSLAARLGQAARRRAQAHAPKAALESWNAAIDLVCKERPQRGLQTAARVSPQRKKPWPWNKDRLRN